MADHWQFIIRKRKTSGTRSIVVSSSTLVTIMIVLSGAVVASVYLVWNYMSQSAIAQEIIALERNLTIYDDNLNFIAEQSLKAQEEIRGIRILTQKAEGNLGRYNPEPEGGTGGASPYNDTWSPRRIAYLNSESEYLDQILSSIEDLELVSYIEKNRTLSITRYLQSHHALIRALPSIRPVSGGYISSPFGNRADPFSGRQKFHPGVDISNGFKTPVLASGEGMVSSIKWTGSYGNLVTIFHGFGLTTLYAHLDKVNVKPGQWISQGQVIGLMGRTGRTNGLHLHYEVHLEGRPVNPYYFLPPESQS